MLILRDKIKKLIILKLKNDLFKSFKNISLSFFF